MGRITVTLPDELEKRFREVVEVRLGRGKGALSLAATKAVSEWLKRGEAKQE